MPLFSRGLNPLLADWKGRSAWVVGASSGIGRATAEALHRQGARAIVSPRHGGAVKAFVRGRGGCLALPLDVTDAAAVDAAAQAVLAHAGGAPDLILYCAGHYRPLRATEFDLAEMQHHLAVNYGGVLHLLDAALPMLLKAGRGHLALVGSVAGYRGLPMSLAYGPRSEEHTSELQSHSDLVCRLLLEKKKSPPSASAPMARNRSPPSWSTSTTRSRMPS